jgi:hypothetical protein
MGTLTVDPVERWKAEGPRTSCDLFTRYPVSGWNADLLIDERTGLERLRCAFVRKLPNKNLYTASMIRGLGCAGASSHSTIRYAKKGKTMNAFEFRNSLEKLEITQHEAAEMLGVSLRTTASYAAGNKIPEPIARLLRLIVFVRRNNPMTELNKVMAPARRA